MKKTFQILVTSLHYDVIYNVNKILKNTSNIDKEYTVGKKIKNSIKWDKNKLHISFRSIVMTTSWNANKILKNEKNADISKNLKLFATSFLLQSENLMIVYHRIFLCVFSVQGSE